MQRSISLTTALFLFFYLQLYSQDQNVNLTINSPKYIEWNDLTFNLNQRGMQTFIDELKMGDPEMFGQMQFGYNQLIKKQKSAQAIGIIGTVVGALIVVTGYNSLPLLIAGTTIGSVSFAYGSLNEIRESDWLNLINSYNKATNNNKIKISLQPLVAHQFTGGVMSLQWRF